MFVVWKNSKQIFVHVLIIMTVWNWPYFKTFSIDSIYFVQWTSTIFTAHLWNIAEWLLHTEDILPDIMNLRVPWKRALRYCTLLTYFSMSHLTHWTSLKPSHFYSLIVIFVFWVFFLLWESFVFFFIYLRKC